MFVNSIWKSFSITHGLNVRDEIRSFKKYCSSLSNERWIKLPISKFPCHSLNPGIAKILSIARVKDNCG